MIAVSSHARGAVLPVRAKPGAKRDRVVGEHAGALRVEVAAPPEDGKANDAIVRVLAESLDCRRSQVTLLAGGSSRSKTFLFEGIDATGLRERIEAILPRTPAEPPDTEP